ncbi:hypothetical protein P2318_32345 [Myxococcaceae bacterium GXIMD 01537]
MSARERLAQAQAELARALGLGAPVPEGFDADRVREAARALLAKRRRGVERSWPRLAAALGESFPAHFDAWARTHALGVEASALADGRHFIQALLTEGTFPEAAREELTLFDLRFRVGDDALVARRGLGLRLARWGAPRRLYLALRLPGGHVLRLRLG